MQNAFTAPHFQSHEAARAVIERLRWPDGPICPHCGLIGKAYATKRPGLFRCAEPECRRDFTVTMNTIMERSKIPLNKWMMALYLTGSSEKHISSHQLRHALGVSSHTAWYLCRRIREGTSDGSALSWPFVEVDGIQELTNGFRAARGQKEGRTPAAAASADPKYST
jgi:Transposase zinc-ribbon domain